jgi:hypothetical protein
LRIVANCIYRYKSINCTFIALVPDLLKEVLGYLADFLISMGGISIAISITLAAFISLVIHTGNYG